MEKLSKTSSEMTGPELAAIAKDLKLGKPAELKALKKPALLKLVQAWEARQLNDPSGDNLVEVEEVWAAGTHEGKKILSRTTRFINDKEYEDITVEGGIVYTVAK